MALSPDELAALYAGYTREDLEQAVSSGPLNYTREAWLAICAECEKRGIPWDQPPTIAPRAAARPAAPGLARKRAREAAIACGIPVALGAIGAGFLIFDDWNFIKRETEIFFIVAAFFFFLFLVVKKMWDGSAVALWTMGAMQALLILMTSKIFINQYSAHDLFGYLFFVVPVGLELMIMRALTALRDERRAGTA